MRAPLGTAPKRRVLVDRNPGRLGAALARPDILTVDEVAGMLQVKRRQVQRLGIPFPRLRPKTKHHIPENALAVLYGPPGSGKSFVALAWAMAIATRRLWLGHATNRGAVTYVAAEGGSGLGQRVKAHLDAHELAGPVDILFVCDPV